MTLTVRDCTPDDFVRINEIYNWTIIDNHVSFDTEPYDLARRQTWWEERAPELSCLVAELDGRVVGVTYSSWYRPKVAYRSSMETTVVLDTDELGNGIGSVLLGALLERLITQGVHVAVAIIALPNDASVALHHKLGFRTVGVLEEVGFKGGRYWDTMVLQRPLT
ncbi:MAG: GNAT family N-acetyltransferase [Acidimicrobiia bacterium]|nr:GNAT family N-acetyltransferase [Acidimicrobiia bacterium]